MIIIIIIIAKFTIIIAVFCYNMYNTMIITNYIKCAGAFCAVC